MHRLIATLTIALVATAAVYAAPRADPCIKLLGVYAGPADCDEAWQCIKDAWALYERDIEHCWTVWGANGFCDEYETCRSAAFDAQYETVQECNETHCD